MGEELDALTGMLDYEVEASKRYRRFVSLVMMHVKPTAAGLQVDNWLRNIPEDAFRTTDRVFGMNRAGTVAVLMGETSSQGALSAVERFQELYQGALAVHSSIAAYPGDGLSSQDLLNVAQCRLNLAEQSGEGTAIWRNEDGHPSQGTAEPRAN